MSNKMDTKSLLAIKLDEIKVVNKKLAEFSLKQDKFGEEIEQLQLEGKYCEITARNGEWEAMKAEHKILTKESDRIKAEIKNIQRKD